MALSESRRGPRLLSLFEGHFDCPEQIEEAYVRLDASGQRRLDERIFDDLLIQDGAERRRVEAWCEKNLGARPPEVATGFSRAASSSSSNLDCGTSHEAWLLRIDPQGRLSSYLPFLRSNFDCAEQVIEAYTEEQEPLGQVLFDPQLFDDLGVVDPGHRDLFEQWFASCAARGGLSELIRACHGEERPQEEPLLEQIWRSPVTSTPASPRKAARSLCRGIGHGAASETTAGNTASEATSADDVADASLALRPTPLAMPWREGMTPREAALRPWCASSGLCEELVQRLRTEDVWCPEDLAHLDKQDLADIARGLKKGVQGRFYAAVHALRKDLGLVVSAARTSPL
eukprot:CAMPEP_0170628204 /NCGR_PEP_ID=MMETSP0224-20130122/32523_1 /TAXON_ID=285029 /ORGANISM="Togula jolla, Strain CCCM 725" /LENGTH=343 /DNA_ID=CAMNT_0010955541 /DNA_START=35 /DNA_END=1062 /DNA_ORIENTATION=+